MRKYLMITMALGALIALTVTGIASAGNKPVTVRTGNLELTFNGGFSPTVLPKKTLAPIALSAEGKIKTVDGTHPPALKEFLVETDKNGAVNVKGYPTCTSGKLQAQDTAHAEKICKSAIVGEGKTGIEIAFAESKPVQVTSKLLVFNGGESGGVTTFFIHAYITVPVPSAVVTTVKVKKIHNGRRRQRIGHLIQPQDLQTVHLQGQEGQRPLGQMPRRQAAGPRESDLLRWHRCRSGNHPHLHRQGLRQSFTRISQDKQDVRRAAERPPFFLADLPGLP
jgi:hypothetical protein